MDKDEKIDIINNIFSPSTPIKELKFFTGRENEIQLINNAVSEKGRHIVLYGERGSGKTSLVNIIENIFTDTYIIKISCNRNDNHNTIWRKIFGEITFIEERQNIGFGKTKTNDIFSPELPETKNISNIDILTVLNQVSAPVLIIVDEFDSIEGNQIKTMMADTLKYLSDNTENATVLISGIAENISELLGYHKSLERCIAQVKLPEFTENEIKEIIKLRLKISGLKIPKKNIKLIAKYSSGYAHYAHLISKQTLIESVNNKRDISTEDDLKKGIVESVENSDYSIKEAYKAAVKSSVKKNKFKKIILACATTDTDSENSFSSKTIAEQFNKLFKTDLRKENVRYNLGMLCKTERGEILEKKNESKSKKYTFRNPLMKAFILLKMHGKKSLD